MDPSLPVTPFMSEASFYEASADFERRFTGFGRFVLAGQAFRLLRRVDPQGVHAELEVDLLDPQFLAPSDGSEPFVDGCPLRISPENTVSWTMRGRRERPGREASFSFEGPRSWGGTFPWVCEFTIIYGGIMLGT